MKQSDFNVQEVKVTDIFFNTREDVEKSEWIIAPEVQLEVAMSEDKKMAKVRMHIDVFTDEDDPPFNCKITIEGIFSWSENMDENSTQAFINVNAAALLYSYARPVITQITTFAGNAPLVLPLNNFMDEEYTTVNNRQTET